MHVCFSKLTDVRGQVNVRATVIAFEFMPCIRHEYDPVKKLIAEQRSTLHSPL